MQNGRLCLSLHEDIDALASLSASELTARFCTKPSPVRRLRVNAAPTLTALYDATDGMLAGSPIDVLETRARRIKEDPGLITRFVAAYMAGRTPFPVSPHFEERLYNGFPGHDDEVRAASFHEVAWQDRLNIVQSFDDERLRWFGLRLIYCEARAMLPDALRADIEQQLSAQLNGDGSGAMSYDLAIAEVAGLMDSAEFPSGILSEYHKYLTDCRARAARSMNEGLLARHRD